MQKFKAAVTLTTLLLACFVLLAGCTESYSEKDLVGSWKLQSQNWHMDMKMQADNTYVTRVKKGPLSFKSSGDWRIKGDKLITEVKESTLGAAKKGTSSMKILELTEKKLVVKDGEDKNVMKRVGS